MLTEEQELRDEDICSRGFTPLQAQKLRQFGITSVQQLDQILESDSGPNFIQAVIAETPSLG